MLRLTDEQAYAVDLALKKESLKIEALAGTGKTSTLKAIAEAMPGKRLVYLAFNKSIADEAARKFPRHVDCRTSHSLAYRSHGAAYRERLNQKLNGDALAQMLGVYEYHGIKAKTLCSIALETIRLFCQGSSRELSKWNLPKAEMAALEIGSDAEAVGGRILDIARKTWSEMENPRGRMPVTHDFYLKLWAMSEPEIRGDVILLDEAQDANSLLLDVLTRQRCQVIFVGDQYQQIYSWRGAVNAMRRFESQNVARLTQSFRFGTAVADVANEVLFKMLGAKHPIRGNPARESRLDTSDRPKAILCRTNAECIRQVVESIDQGLKVHLQGGTAEFKATVQGIEDLKRGKVPYSQTLSLFTSYEQLLEFSETELGQDLKTTIKLTDEYGTKELLGIIARIEGNKEDTADVTISTGHKSKGREWQSVRLGGDFRGPDDKGYHDEDGNLLYVAVTRAIDTLDLSWSEVFENGKLRRKELDPESQAEAPATEQRPALSLIDPAARLLLSCFEPAPAKAAEPMSDPIAITPDSAPKRKAGRTSKASEDDIRAYLQRVLRERRVSILALPDEAGEAFRELELSLNGGDIHSWIQSYLSKEGKTAMLTTLRTRSYKSRTPMRNVELHEKAAEALSAVAESEGRTMSEMLMVLLEAHVQQPGGTKGGINRLRGG